MKTEHKRIRDRQTRQKEQFLELYKKTPIIQIVCERIGIGRSTYYRWIEEDKEFFAKTIKAEQEGRGYLNDLMESKLIQMGKDGNATAIIFFLKNNSSRYSESYSGILARDIQTITDYLKNDENDISHDREFIASLFEKRIPSRVARQVIYSMRQLKNWKKQQNEETKLDLLGKLSTIKRK